MQQRLSFFDHRYRHHRLAVALLALAFATSGMATTPDVVTNVAPASAPTAVIIGGEVSPPLTLDAAALAKMPHVDVQASDHGVTGTWSGGTSGHDSDGCRRAAG